MPIGDEEKEMVHQYIATGNLELAARGSGVVPVDASSAVAKRTAMQALGDSEVKAYFIELMEEAELTPLEMMQTLKRNLSTKKYALHQISGQAVEIGDDGMTQLTAAKLIMQGAGLLGGGAKTEPTDRNAAPTQVNIFFPDRDIRSSKNAKDNEPIDGDNLYTAS